MTALALDVPMVQEASYYAPAPRRLAQQGAIIMLFQDVWCTPTPVSRTATFPDQQQASESTSSSYTVQATGLAVVFQRPASEVLAPAESGSDDRVPSMLSDIKKMTSWSWERVAASLGCTRQAVHAWTLGKEISGPNLERLAKLHATLSFVDRGDAEQNSALLHTAGNDGHIVADMLNAGRFDEVRALAGQGDEARSLAARRQFTASVQPDVRRTHWFARLAETKGEEVPLEIVPPGVRKPLALRRRG